jgi:hypothetical protein
VTYSRVKVVLALTALAVGGAACANAPIARPLAVGNCTAAVAAFSADVRAQSNPAALRLVARAYASPDCETWSPDTALLMLARAEAIDSAPSFDDRRLESLLTALLRERATLASAIEVHERILTAREAELVALRSERDDLAVRALGSRDEARALQSRVTELELLIDGLQAQLIALAEELEALKQVDLRGRP